MTSNSDASDYTGVLLEELRENFRVVMEAVGDIQRQVYALPEIRQNTQLLMEDVEVVKAAIRSLSNEVGGLTRWNTTSIEFVTSKLPRRFFHAISDRLGSQLGEDATMELWS